MRKRTIFGVALAAAVAAIAFRRRSANASGGIDDTAEVSPIDEPIPGDEPIDDADVPRDHSE